MAAPRKRASSADSPQTQHVLSERFADPDLVDRVFDYVLELMPEIAGRAEEVKRAVRAEFAGERVSVRTRDYAAIAEEILRAFDGRNATEVARRLGIGRATVYRTIKRAAKARP